jgi:cytidine deaminase
MAVTPAPAQVTAPADMPEKDVELLRAAELLLAACWVAGRHEVATALRLRDGSVHHGVHLEGSCRRSSICAEGIALGAARSARPDGPLDVVSVVSVQVKPAGQFRVIAPCGVCRELISDYAPGARVWLTEPGTGLLTVHAALDLLPEKTRRSW